LRIYYNIINYATIMTRTSTERKHKRGESQANTIWFKCQKNQVYAVIWRTTRNVPYVRFRCIIILIRTIFPVFVYYTRAVAREKKDDILQLMHIF